MKYNIKVENSFGRTMRDIVLSNRNLTEKDVVKLLNNNLGSVTESPYKLENMGEAVQLFMQEYDKEAKIRCGWTYKFSVIIFISKGK